MPHQNIAASAAIRGVAGDILEIEVEFAGSESLSFLPMAQETEVELAAPWPNPRQVPPGLS